MIRRRILVCAIAIAVAALLSSTPAAATGLVWRDDFQDASGLRELRGVVVSDGGIALGPDAVQIADPVIREGIALSLADAGNALQLTSPTVLRLPDRWLMFYTATFDGSSFGIYVATSQDAIQWVPLTSPVLGEYGRLFAYQEVLLIGTLFHMWYAVNSGSGYEIHHATSSDGFVWEPLGVVLPQEFDGGRSVQAYAPSVLWDGQVFRMWYSGFDGSVTTIRYATSADGTSWQRFGVVLAPLPGGEFDQAGPRLGAVAPTSEGYVMWYTCVSVWEGTICRAKSSDGVLWTREGIVLAPDPASTSEDLGVGDPAVYADSDGTFRVWYFGRGTGANAQIFRGRTTAGSIRSGHATSIPIRLPEGDSWSSLVATWSTPVGTWVTIDVIDATTGRMVPGLSGLQQTWTSLRSLDGLAAIELRASLFSRSSESPVVSQWLTVSVP